ncbi:MAG: alpha/beta hydrolase [Pseudomonadota bacterium]
MTETVQPHLRRERVSYMAPIGVGYDMTADHMPLVIETDEKWRVVTIPGTPSRPYMYNRYMRVAPGDLDVFTVNRAGYGGPVYGAARREPVLSFDDQVAAIAPLFDKDDGFRTITVGVSYGGELALKCALDYPDRIAGVVTVAALVTEPYPYINAITPLAEHSPIKEILPGYLHNARAEVEGRRKQIGPLLDRLGELTCPVTILHGNLDNLVAQSDAEVLLGHFPEHADVKYEPINGGTHYLELQMPRRLYAAIRDVISRANTKDKDVVNGQ